jgi:hypothetical protein
MIPLSQKGALRMLRVPRLLHHLVQLTCTLLTLLVDAAHFLWLCLHSPTALAAENLFLRKQLAPYQERHVTPRRATDATRLALIWLGRWCATRHVHPLASAGIPPVLAVEVHTWTPADPCGPASAHPSYGP